MNSVQAVSQTSKAKTWLALIVMTGTLVVLVQLTSHVAAGIHSAANAPGRVVVVRVTAIAIAEWVTLIAATWWQRREGRSLSALGLWRRATPLTWVLGIGLGLLTAYWGLSNPSLHLPGRLGALFNLRPWHVYSALVAGLTGGFCEEILFRGIAMQKLASAGYGPWAQAGGSAVLFGLAHGGVLQLGLVPGLLVILPTAFLGLLYAFIVLRGNRSLMPVIASHFLNDLAVIPWLLFWLATIGH